jgi:hypothetical protein
MIEWYPPMIRHRKIDYCALNGREELRSFMARPCCCFSELRRKRILVEPQEASSIANARAS